MILNNLCISLLFYRLLDSRVQSPKVKRSCGVEQNVHFFSECELKHIISFWCVLSHFGVVIIILLAMVFNVWCRIALTDPRECQLLRMRVCLRLIRITSTNISLLINQGSELKTCCIHIFCAQAFESLLSS